MNTGTRTSLTYDNAGRVTQVTSLKSDNTEITDFQYTYDNVGNRLSVVDSNGDRTTWTYDGTRQLLSEHRTGANAWRHTFTYDAVGNRTLQNEDATVTTSVYDAANRTIYRETPTGRTTFTFDADGNQTRTETPAGDLTTYIWDSQCRQTQVELPSTEIVTYTYNGDNLRIQQDDGIDVTHFLHDDRDLILETDDTLTNVRRLVYKRNLPPKTRDPKTPTGKDPEPTPSNHSSLPNQEGGNTSFTNGGNTSHSSLPLTKGETQRGSHNNTFGHLISQEIVAEADTFQHHFDALGSTAALTDGAEVITDEYDYQAHGETAASTGLTPNPFQWVLKSAIAKTRRPTCIISAAGITTLRPAASRPRTRSAATKRTCTATWATTR